MSLNNTNSREYQQCTLSLMDTIADPDISFDKEGVCNYYHEYKQAEKESLINDLSANEKLESIISKIKETGKNSKYDCIIGVSGGVDSTYVTFLAKQFELRPLVVHFDNGWNSELAVKNVENIVNNLGFDLHTLVVDWNEFRDLQLSYLKASVVDIEVATDHAISGTIARLSKKYGIKYSLSGSNIVTEFTMPKSWIFNKSDHVNLKAIHNKYGTVPLKSYPIFSSYLKRYLNNVLHMESINILNYVPYNYKNVKELIAKELGWRDYGGKHFESIFTKFFQAYILPEKFKIDKRKAHLSTMIYSGQLSKEDALIEIAKPLYPKEELSIDYEFVLKKFGLTTDEFNDIMHLPIKSHWDFPVELSIYKRYPILKSVKIITDQFKKR